MRPPQAKMFHQSPTNHCLLTSCLSESMTNTKVPPYLTSLTQICCAASAPLFHLTSSVPSRRSWACNHHNFHQLSIGCLSPKPPISCSCICSFTATQMTTVLSSFISWVQRTYAIFHEINSPSRDSSTRVRCELDKGENVSVLLSA